MAIPNNYPVSSEPTTTRQISTYVLLTVTLTLLTFVGLIGLATTLTGSNWWQRRRRAYLRRVDATKRNEKPTVKVQMVGILQGTIEALSLRANEDSVTAIKYTERSKLPVKLPMYRFSIDQRELPLRFQPEKLYGATTTVHRDNLRKKSCVSLSVQQPPSSTRRASMIESLMFLVPTTSDVDSAVDAKETAKISALTVTQAYPQLNKPNDPIWKIGELPQIDVTCEGETSVSGALVDSFEFMESTKDDISLNTLSINLPIRRASSTNFELSNVRLENPQDMKLNLEIIKGVSGISSGSGVGVGGAHSDVESTRTNIKPDSEGIRPFAKKRSSLLDTFLYHPTKQMQGHFFTQPVVIKHPQDPKLPSTPNLNDSEDYGGMIALKITKTQIGQPKLIVQLIAAKGLKCYRPWQKASFTLRFYFKNEHNTLQQASISCKNSEFGTMSFRQCPSLEFDLVNSNEQEPQPSSSPPLPTSSPITSGELSVHIYETLTKWSVEREFYHGSLCVPLTNIALQTFNWYQLLPAYPIIQMKADILVSLCQRPLDGLISMGVHEVRNIRFEVKGPWELGNINQLIDWEQLNVKIHACLTFENHLIKTKKSLALQSSGIKKSDTRPFTISTSSSHGEVESSSGKKHSTYGPYSRLIGSDTYIQFIIPGLKRSTAKLPSSNYGVLLYLNQHVPVTNRLPPECVNQLRSQNVMDIKTLNAYGRCFIGDALTQAEYRKMAGLIAKADSPSASLWDEAMFHGSSRVYQWLTIE